MHKLRLFIIFYKSTLTLSILFSVTVAVLRINLGFLTAYGLAFMTIGLILSLYYKEMAYKNEYVYYQNMGITKPFLIISSFLTNVLIGTICLIYDHA